MTPARHRERQDAAAHVLASVRSRDYGYWLEAGDFESRATFSSISVLLRLIQAGAPGQAPVLTIPDAVMETSA